MTAIAPEVAPVIPELPEAPVPGPRQRGRRNPLTSIASWLFLVAVATYFIFPLLAMARFAFQRVPVILFGWSTLFERWTWDGLFTAFRDESFGPTLWLSARLALGTIALTLALMLPTAMWVHLRLPSARGAVETLTVLPYVVPPIALVVGVIGAYKDSTPWFFNSALSLIPFYAVLAMPFTYRSLDAGLRAIDLRTLVDASRSLGAGWGTTMFRVLVPNMRTSLLTASFLTATVVMGEFTMAQLTGKFTLPVFQAQFYLREVQGGIALGLVTLLATTLLLAFVTFLTRRRGVAAAPVAGAI
jgi:putative spermidine/putrescine transport system permease protein